ncbi:MAG: TorD-like chaperone [Clostridiales bacterium]|jgi:TorA maturation chaperone TorD|nr:TorD-like chaperone [Clostridiales bacterium]
MQNLKFDSLASLEKRFNVYQVFCNYYNSKLWDYAKWPDVIYILNEYDPGIKQPDFKKGLNLLANISPKDINQAVYDYNCLFVGPGKLLAPPYESAYLNSEGLVMQEETLKVRKFYNKAGLQFLKKGIEPDDHLGLQLDFICYLLSRCAWSMAENKKASLQNYHELYRDFLTKHLQKWIFKHCDSILKNSTTTVCYAMSLILKGFMKLEQSYLDSCQGGSNVG